MIKRSVLVALIALTIAPTSRAAAPPDPPSVCLKLPPGFGIDCIPGQGIAALSKACSESVGEVAITACTKEIESADAEVRIWARLLRAFPEARLKRFDSALVDFNAVLASKPDLYLALLGRAATYIAVKKYDLARPDAERARDLQPDNFMSYVILAGLHAVVGDIEAAKDDARQIMSMKLNNAELYYLRGRFFSSLGSGSVFSSLGRSNTLALKDFTQAIALEPHHSEALLHRSNIYANTNNTDLAVGDCNSVTESIKAARVHGCLGFAYEMAGRDSEAVAEFDKAIALEPGDADSRQNRGSLYLLNGHYAEAVLDFEAAIALRQDEMGYYSNLGLAQRHLGHQELAEAAFSKAIALAPAAPAPYLNRGVAYMDRSAFDLALADFRKALELSPGDKNAMRGIAHALRRQPAPLDTPPRDRLGVTR